MRPARVHIEEGVDVETLSGERMDVDRIDLYKIASGSHVRSLW